MSYSNKYLEHFTNPKGIGDIDKPTSIIEVQHEGGGCFDRIRLSVLVKDSIIEDIKFRARACSGTIAASSALVEMVKGKSIEEARGLSPQDIENYLDGIPDKKKHSVELAVEALKKAIG